MQEKPPFCSGSKKTSWNKWILLSSLTQSNWPWAKSHSKLGIWVVTKQPEKHGETTSQTWMALSTWSTHQTLRDSRKAEYNCKESFKSPNCKRSLLWYWGIKSTRQEQSPKTSWENIWVSRRETIGIRERGQSRYLCAVWLRRKDTHKDLSGWVLSWNDVYIP